jgi:hypothetical protein
MKKTETYTQCKMKKGTLTRIGWIPTQFAVIGKFIELKMLGVWSKGWLVTERWSVGEASYIEAREMDYKKQRSASDI